VKNIKGRAIHTIPKTKQHKKKNIQKIKKKKKKKRRRRRRRERGRGRS